MSCWAPEEFTATLNIDKEANYEFHYEGTIAFGPALGEIAKLGRLSDKDEEAMKKAESGLRESREFSRVDYIGSGRFRVVYDTKDAIGKEPRQLFMGLLTITRDEQGQVFIEGSPMKEDAREQMKAIGLKLDGKLKVNTALPIIRHNAASEPMLGGLIGSYEWHVSLDQKETPFMVLDAGAGASPGAAAGAAEQVKARQTSGGEDAFAGKAAGGAASDWQTPDFARQIVGCWRGERAITEYRGDGTYAVTRIPDSPGAPAVGGTWKIEGNMLTKTYPSIPPATYTILQMDQAVLRLQDAEGHAYSQSRVASAGASVETSTSLPRPGQAEAEEMARADAELNAAYKQAMAKMTAVARKVLREEELDWIKWRDAEAARLAMASSAGGSSYRVDYLKAMTALIKRRTEELKGGFRGSSN